MSRKSCIITLGLLLGLLVACSAEPQVVEVTVEVEVTSEVEVIKEVEVEAEPFPTPPINLTTAPGTIVLVKVRQNLLRKMSSQRGKKINHDRHHLCRVIRSLIQHRAAKQI